MADVEVAKNWTKLITHPVTREIEKRIAGKIGKIFGDGAVVIFSHFTEIMFECDQIVDEDSSFHWEDVDKDGYIPVFVYKNNLLSAMHIKLEDLLDS